jgi:hypothetical protein
VAVMRLPIDGPSFAHRLMHSLLID